MKTLFAFVILLTLASGIVVTPIATADTCATTTRRYIDDDGCIVDEVTQCCSANGHVACTVSIIPVCCPGGCGKQLGDKTK